MTQDKQYVVTTHEELLKVLMTKERYEFTHLVMVTTPSMNKTNNKYYKNIKKVTKGNFNIGVDYERRVRNNEEKEGLSTTFESDKPSGKHYVSKCVLQSDKYPNLYYLMLEYFLENNPKVDYYFQGNTIEKHLFEKYLSKKKESTKQVQKRKVHVISPLITSIQEISIDGVHYVIE
jgi:hypothetical protein